VPETTIDEHNEFPPREYDVGSARKIGVEPVPTEAEVPEQLSEKDFRFRITRPDSRHVEGAGCLVVDVHLST
jgi:hypothetical protein